MTRGPPTYTGTRMHYGGPTLMATTLVASSAAGALFGQAPTDALGWIAQLGPVAGAAFVAWVAFVYIRKRDDDAKIVMDRQEAQAVEDRAAVNRLFDRVDSMGRENREALAATVDKMDRAIRDNAQVHSNGLAQLTAAVQTVMNVIGNFSGELQSIKSDMDMLMRVSGLRHQDADEDEGRADSKQVKTPKQLPRKGGGSPQ